MNLYGSLRSNLRATMVYVIVAMVVTCHDVNAVTPVWKVMCERISQHAAPAGAVGPDYTL